MDDQDRKKVIGIDMIGFMIVRMVTRIVTRLTTMRSKPDYVEADLL